MKVVAQIPSGLSLLAICALLAGVAGCSIKVAPQAESLVAPAATQALPADRLFFQSDEAPVLSYGGKAPTSPVLSVQGAEGELNVAVPATSGAGTFKLSVTDAPVAGFEAVYVSFSRIELRNKATGETVEISANPVEIDLLKLQDGLKKTFEGVSLAAGTYSNLRFFFSSVAVVVSGKRIGVAIPKQLAEQGLRIYGSFEIVSGGIAEALIDFDVNNMFLHDWSGFIFRPVAKLRHLHFNPAGIHFEEADDGTLTLVGPVGTVRARAWLELTDGLGRVSRSRAHPDGSIRFPGIAKVLGEKMELAVVERRGKSDKFAKGKKGGEEPSAEPSPAEPVSADGSSGGSVSSGNVPGNPSEDFTWVKMAWLELRADFSVDAKYPRIMASHLEALFTASFESVGRVPSAFLALFATDAFRYLAGRYVQLRGLELPAGFEFPSLPVPYAFSLEGPDYELPGYSFSRDAVGNFSGGPTSAGCADARVVFEGPAPSNDYGSLEAGAAMSRMIAADLPFTGLLAEYEAVCHGRDLAELSCATLGSLARGGSASLPALPLPALEGALNSPRGGLLVGLLGCVRPVELSPVPVPAFPSSQPTCVYGCRGGTTETYLADSELLLPGAADALIPSPEAIADLDSLVLLADANGLPPLKLAASYLADHALSKIHGFADRSAPRLSNLQPVNGFVTTSESVQVSGLASDRTVVSVEINGQGAPFELGADGQVHIPAFPVTLIDGLNIIELVVRDEAGNSGTASLSVTADLPDPEPSPTPTETGTTDPSPTPSPSPTATVTPTPTPSPSPVVVPGVDSICSEGAFVPKATLRLGLTIDPADSNYTRIISAFQAMGFSPIVYGRDEIAAGKPITDGVNVLVLTRIATFAPLPQSFIESIRAFAAGGGSLLTEFDGSALLFSSYSQPTTIVLNFTPSFQLFGGAITGGGALFPLEYSTTYVVDSSDPIFAGLGNFNVGVRTAFALTGFNSDWLHPSAQYVSPGFNGLLPIGTFPAVVSGRCGGGRVAAFTMNYFSSITQQPVSTMVRNALSWLAGQ
ncbi:MAG: DUF4382 domain-containing protein [Oligoflexia bacterium]|nr:DUF4382 domain-containing protein [Oligoflexia bacterium]